MKEIQKGRYVGVHPDFMHHVENICQLFPHAAEKGKVRLCLLSGILVRYQDYPHTALQISCSHQVLDHTFGLLYIFITLH